MDDVMVVRKYSCRRRLVEANSVKAFVFILSKLGGYVKQIDRLALIPPFSTYSSPAPVDPR
jgi:hypothetical protein